MHGLTIIGLVQGDCRAIHKSWLPRWGVVRSPGYGQEKPIRILPCFHQARPVQDREGCLAFQLISGDKFLHCRPLKTVVADYNLKWGGSLISASAARFDRDYPSELLDVAIGQYLSAERSVYLPVHRCRSLCEKVVKLVKESLVQSSGQCYLKR